MSRFSRHNRETAETDKAASTPSHIRSTAETGKAASTPSLQSASSSPSAGLTAAEAARRLEQRGPFPPPPSSRSYTSIIRANVFTLFNAILLVFGVITLVFGDWRDALFLAIVVGNSGIGIFQEVRAKRALDRLAALIVPKANVIRDGHEKHVDVGDLVVDDLVTARAGDQIVADGTLQSTDGVALDESVLTGESEPVVATAGDELRSGSFVVEGSCTYLVSAVGPDSYAERVAGVARQFRHPRSPLEHAINRLLLGLVVLMVLFGAVLGYALLHRQPGTKEAVSTATAAVVTMVPEGLILLTSLTFAVGALRMARRGALAQQLNAIESLASVDVVCLDKTGTLTDPTLRVLEIVPLDEVDEDRFVRQLTRYAASSDDRNSTLTAIAEKLPGDRNETVRKIPFSSRRKWSALEFEDVVLVLGAPELFAVGSLTATIEKHTVAGRRVIALGHGQGPLDDSHTDGPPPQIQLLGIVVLSEHLRSEAREMVEYFNAENVEIKVISGDAPSTVASIARDAGIAFEEDAVVDARSLPSDPNELRTLALRAKVFGRVSPDQKRQLVELLRDSGHYVAMVGDGVNDVPAMKAARLAFAQASGTQMARSIADIVLVRGDFASVVPMLGQGRQMLRNLQRVSKLYVTKSSLAAFLILLVGTTDAAYPLLPRQLSLAAAVTIGIPTFFLALAPSQGRWRISSFVRDVAHFAIPAGMLVGVGLLGSYYFCFYALDMSVIGSRTVATTVLVAVGLYLIAALEAEGRRRTQGIVVLISVMAALYVLVLAISSWRHFFSLAGPNFGIIVTSLGGIAISCLGLYLTGFAPTQITQGEGYLSRLTKMSFPSLRSRTSEDDTQDK